MPGARSRRPAPETFFAEPLHPYTRGTARRLAARRCGGTITIATSPLREIPGQTLHLAPRWPTAGCPLRRRAVAHGERACLPRVAMPHRPRVSSPAQLARRRRLPRACLNSPCGESASCWRSLTSRAPTTLTPCAASGAARGRRRDPSSRARRDGRAGRRIRLRQVHARQDDPAPRAVDRRAHHASTAPTSRGLATRRTARRTAGACR